MNGGLDKLDRAAAEWARQDQIARLRNLPPPTRSQWDSGEAEESLVSIRAMIRYLAFRPIEALIMFNPYVRAVVIEQRRHRQEMADRRESR